MRIPHLVAGAWLLAGALSACGGGDRTVYTVPPPPASSLEALFSTLGPQLAFADLLDAQRSEGTAWMFEPIVAREWGVN